MKKKPTPPARKKYLRRTFHTQPLINQALNEYANKHERSVAWVINAALRKFLGVRE